jgi:hypothetical protein
MTANTPTHPTPSTMPAEGAGRRCGDCGGSITGDVKQPLPDLIVKHGYRAFGQWFAAVWRCGKCRVARGERAA